MLLIINEKKKPTTKTNTRKNHNTTCPPKPTNQPTKKTHPTPHHQTNKNPTPTKNTGALVKQNAAQKITKYLRFSHTDNFNGSLYLTLSLALSNNFFYWHLFFLSTFILKIFLLIILYVTKKYAIISLATQIYKLCYNSAVRCKLDMKVLDS